MDSIPQTPDSPDNVESVGARGASEPAADQQVTPLVAIGLMIQWLDRLSGWNPSCLLIPEDESNARIAQVWRPFVVLAKLCGQLDGIEAAVLPKGRRRGRCQNNTVRGDLEGSPLVNLRVCEYVCGECAEYSLEVLREIEQELREKPGSQVTQTPSGGDPRSLIWEQSGDRLVIGGAEGEVASVKCGTAGWACLVTLHARRGQVISYAELPGLVDTVLAGPAGEEHGSVSSDRLRPEGRDHSERSQLLRRTSRRSREAYSAMPVAKAIGRLQSVIRRATGTKAAQWRDRWIHWNAVDETVIFEGR